LVGALVAIPVIFFVATSTGGTANANKTGAAPTAIKSATPAPPPVLVQQPVASENPESVQATPMPTPLVTDPPPSLVEDRSAPSERAKPAAPVTRKTPTIVKKKEKSREQKLAEARCALTDDC
jgi:type IV secretory pathway VirB10-like protein